MKSPLKREISLAHAMDYYNDNEVNIMDISPIRPDTPLKVVFEDNVKFEEQSKGYGYNVAKDIITSIGNIFASLGKEDDELKRGRFLDVPLPKFKEIPAPLSPERNLDEDLLLPHDNGRKNKRPLNSIIRADISSSTSPFPSPLSSSRSCSKSPSYRRCSERISDRPGMRKDGFWKDFIDTGSDISSDEDDY